MRIFIVICLFLYVCEACELPDCFPAGTRPPANFTHNEIPQFIMLTFDDAITHLANGYYRELFNNRANPNGCPITGTFFVSDEYTEYQIAHSLFLGGHEMADHTVTHKSTDHFRYGSLERWESEISGVREAFYRRAGIPKDKVVGFRSPFLMVSGNNQFDALTNLGMKYDSSMPTHERLWPYTLDKGPAHSCIVGDCPTKDYPGFWEVPMVQYAGGCSMLDACYDGGSRAGVFRMLQKNFWPYYYGNRAPFPVFLHASWFMIRSYRLYGLMDFLDAMLELTDVYVVPVLRVLQWMENPIPVSQLSTSKFGCPPW